MRFLPLLVLASQLAAAQVVSSPNEQASSGPLKRDDNGYSKVVSWDKYSLIVNGQRIFVHGGEFHPFRLPVSEHPLPVVRGFAHASLTKGPGPMVRCITKIQSCRSQCRFHLFPLVGWKSVAFPQRPYALCRGMSNPSKGVLDFDGVRALQPLLDAAKEVGLWVILRPGMSLLPSLIKTPRDLHRTRGRCLGPYINAETSAGGMPHWVTAEVPGTYHRASYLCFALTVCS